MVVDLKDASGKKIKSKKVIHFEMKLDLLAQIFKRALMLSEEVAYRTTVSRTLMYKYI